MRTTIIGCGNMGSAIARGLYADKDFMQKNNLTVSNRSSEKLHRLLQTCPNIEVTTDNLAAATQADILILAVKPWQIDEVCIQIKKVVQPHTIIVSVAAGIDTEHLTSLFETSNGCPAVFQAIPNTAIAVRQSTTILTARHASQTETETIVNLFSSLGSTWILEEKNMYAAMILGSCGTAFAMRYVRAAMEAGIELGISAQQSRQIVAQTLKGAAELLIQEENHPEQEIDKVTTPGGITIRGLNRMEACGFSNAVIEGHKACQKQP